jgi:hypothetical protein
MPYLRILLSSLCVCGFAATSHAAQITLHVTPGLWQMTSSGETHGAPPIPADMLARLPPAQRAKMQAVLAATMARAGKPHVYKSCVTEKSLQRGFDPSEHSSGEKCKSTVLSSSASMMDVRVECVGERHGEHTNGHFHFVASSPVAMKGTIDMTMSDGAHTMRVKRVMQGQWLSADCGKYAHNDD